MSAEVLRLLGMFLTGAATGALFMGLAVLIVTSDQPRSRK